MAENRIAWLDYGKCICMLMVIFLHTCDYYTGKANLFLHLMNPTRLLVFFFISGYLIKLDTFDFKRMMSSICKKLLFPYFVFTTLIWIPKHLLRGEGISMEMMLHDILGGFASWFVAALAVSKITMSVILYFTRNLRTIWIVCMTLVITGFMMTQYIDSAIPWQIDYGLKALLYLALGMTYKRYEKRVSGKMGLQAVLSVVIYFVCVSLDYFCFEKSTYIFGEVSFVGAVSFIFLSLLGIWMMISLVKLLPDKIEWMTYIGKNSLTYYYLNTGLLMVLVTLLNKAGLGYDGKYFMVYGLFLVTIAVLTLISKLILRYAPWMVGNFGQRRITQR